MRKRRLRLQITHKTINKRSSSETPQDNNKINVLLVEAEVEEEGEEKYGAIENVESTVEVAAVDFTCILQSANTLTSDGGTPHIYPGFLRRSTSLGLGNLVKRRVKFTLLNKFPSKSSDLTHGLLVNVGKYVRLCQAQSNNCNFGFKTHRVQKVNSTDRSNKTNVLIAMANCDL